MEGKQTSSGTVVAELWMGDCVFAIALFFHCKPVIGLVDLVPTANITLIF